MTTTVKDIRRYLDDLPDDAPVFIEFPHNVRKKDVIRRDGWGEEGWEFIRSYSVGRDKDKKALYIFFNY